MKSVTVAVIDIEGIHLTVTETGETMALGVEGRLLNIILETLSMKPKFVIPLDKQWGSLGANGNWTGMIGMVHKGEADIAINSLAPSESRMKAADFSAPYTMSDATFAIKKPGTLPKTLVFVHPFTPETWLSCILLMIIFPFILRWLLSTKKSYFYLCFKTVSDILKQPIKLELNSKLDSLLMSLWWFFAIVISFSYSAVLLSSLTLPLTAEPVRDFRKLSEVVTKGDAKCFITKGTLHERILLQSDQEYLKKLGLAINRNKWYAETSNNSNPYSEYIQEKIAYLNIRSFFIKHFGLSRNVFISSDYLTKTPVAIAMNKHFCCKEKLNNVILRLLEGGIYEKIFQEEALKAFFSLHKKMPQDDKNAIRPLFLEDIFGVFLILSFGLVFSSVVFLLELCYFKKDSGLIQNVH